jgi:hypothetical protein
VPELSPAKRTSRHGAAPLVISNLLRAGRFQASRHLRIYSLANAAICVPESDVPPLLSAFGIS